jgi:hypothetical protein
MGCTGWTCEEDVYGGSAPEVEACGEGHCQYGDGAVDERSR